MDSTGTFKSDLAEYCKKLLDKWTKQRADVELKWKKNDDAFNSIVTGDTWKKEEAGDWRSDTFISITKIKVLMAYSMVIDLQLQGGRFPFDLQASPWDLVLMEDMPPEQQTVLQDNIDDMKALIQQQLLDCKGDRELMKCVMAAAKLGETYWKTYVIDVTRKGFNTETISGGGFEENVFKPFENEIKSMAFEYVSCWDMFRNMETDDMQKSQGYCQRSWTSPYGLRQLKTEFYPDSDAPFIDDAIDRVIKEHSKVENTTTSTDSQTPARRKIKSPYNHIQQWEFWCRVPRKIVEDFEKSKGKEVSTSIGDIENDGDEIEVGVTMAEEEVIRVVRIPPDTRPHGRVIWEINLDDNHGIGVSDNVEHVQKTMVGMVRAFEDNKKLSANVILAIKKALLTDWDGQFKPGTSIELAEEAKSAAEAITQIIIQDVGDSLLSGIALMERFGDELSQLPKILQGNVAEKRKPDTLGKGNRFRANTTKKYPVNREYPFNRSKGGLEP